MQKTPQLFIEWNQRKTLLESQVKKHIVKKRQFWLFYVGVNVGNEESKSAPFVRPGLVVNNYLKWDLLLIAPLTSKYNENLNDLYMKIDGTEYWLDKDSYVIMNQFKVISKKRLIRKLNDKDNIPLLKNDQFLAIIQHIKNYI